MKVDFATSGRIIFGMGELKNLPQLTKGLGKRAFIVQSSGLQINELLHNVLDSIPLERINYYVDTEPDVSIINQAADSARENSCDFVIGFGGGSVIDTGKAVSALMTNEGDLLDYLEVVGKGQSLSNFPKPYIAIPTTSGTGSEVTRNAVISVPDNNIKVSMRSPYLLPFISLVDPEVTFSLPAHITAFTGMDAFIQVLEPYVSVKANPMVDMFCRDAIPRAARFLLKAYKNGTDKEARRNMSWVSLMGGLSLANANLGAVHGFAGPIGGMYHAPHGAVCASLLAAVMRVNVDALCAREKESKSLYRYKEIARWITGDQSATNNDGITWIEKLCRSLNIPRLSDMGIETQEFKTIVEKSENASSMKGNPIKLTKEELLRILELSY